MADLDVRENVPLADLATLQVGGPARYYVQAESGAAVRSAVAWASRRGLPLLVLGGGSNLVVSDEGFPGLVLHVRLSGVETRSGGGAVEVTAGAGEPWDELVERAVSAGWAGIECLSGIPGLVGATPIQNVGAYGQDVSETVTRVDAYDRATDAFLSFGGGECGFAYRQSRFKQPDRGRYVILSVTFALRPGGEPAVRYPELQRTLAERGQTSPSLRQVRQAVLDVRRRKSMVIDPQDPNRCSVGSFFVNPVVPVEVQAAVAASLRAQGLDAEAERMPAFPAGDGRVKLSAAWLIERAGLARGYRRGNVGISTNHTLAIVNCGGGTAREVVALAREVRERVRERFGIVLAPEPVFVDLEL